MDLSISTRSGIFCFMTQGEALKILKMGHSAYITGAAGSGKTYLLNEFIRCLKERRTRVGITASTGIASTHLGGFTIHSWAGIGITRTASNSEVGTIASNRRVAKRFTKTNVLIIDEISMLDADRLSLINRVAKAARGNSKPFGGMQVVLCGDFFQLPPVAKKGEPPPQFAYHSSAWKELNPKICYLTEQFRQNNDVLIKVLNAVRQAEVDDKIKNYLYSRQTVPIKDTRITKLYSHNIDVDTLNLRELDSIPGERINYHMKSAGVPAIIEVLKNGCLAPETLTLKKDAVVMFVKNNFEKRYVNGTLGKVSGFNEEGYPIVKTLNGGTFIAEPENWDIEENGKTLAKISQVPLRLAWAITIHKSQGMTLDAAEIDLTDAFENGMGYVALSRVRSLQGIKLLGFNETALKVHPEILAFDGELRLRSEETMREFQNELPGDIEGKARSSSKTYSVSEIRKSYPVAYKKWLPEEDKKLAAGFRAGQTMGEFTKEFGRKSGGIRARLKKMGLVE